jgi:hypothetical protein
MKSVECRNWDSADPDRRSGTFGHLGRDRLGKGSSVRQQLGIALHQVVSWVTFLGKENTREIDVQKPLAHASLLSPHF